MNGRRRTTINRFTAEEQALDKISRDKNDKYSQKMTKFRRKILNFSKKVPNHCEKRVAYSIFMTSLFCRNLSKFRIAQKA
uniref:Uncharacterized protein n=1 Tax=Romanomermis culicivorax TaxID=13658 RepID=A0A915KAB4_ROMCU